MFDFTRIQEYWLDSVSANKVTNNLGRCIRHIVDVTWKKYYKQIRSEELMLACKHRAIVELIKRHAEWDKTQATLVGYYIMIVKSQFSNELYVHLNRYSGALVKATKVNLYLESGELFMLACNDPAFDEIQFDKELSTATAKHVDMDTGKFDAVAYNKQFASEYYKRVTLPKRLLAKKQKALLKL